MKIHYPLGVGLNAPPPANVANVGGGLGESVFPQRGLGQSSKVLNLEPAVNNVGAKYASVKS